MKTLTEEFKQSVLSKIQFHRKMDQLVQGVGAEGVGENFRGCSLGCAFGYYDHVRAARESNVPVMLLHLNDCIFEGLPKDGAMEWPERFWKAVPVGVDLSMVGVRFLLEINRRNLGRLDERQKKLVGGPINQVIEVLEEWLKLGKTDAMAASEAAWAAWASARAAARSARAARAARAAGSTAAAAAAAAAAAESARAVAESVRAARAAESAESTAAARSAEFQWMADLLINLLNREKEKP